MRFPALQLVWSPTGAGSVVFGHGWPIGGTEPVGESGLTFGFEGNVRLRYPPPTEGREICKVELRQGQLWLRHFVPTHYCSVNGKHVEDADVPLRHRDLIGFPRGPVFRVLEREAPQARSPGLEAALRAAPGDRELLHVYTDFLLDHGDALGERLARARSASSDDDAAWLDALASHYEAGRLELEWEHGLVAKATLRESRYLELFGSLEAALQHLAQLPVMRFLRELTLDVSSDRLLVADGVRALAAVKLPESVRRLSLGDMPESQRERVTQELAAAGRPVEVGFYREAVLEMVTVNPDDPVGFKAGDRVPVSSRIELGRADVTSYLNSIVTLAGSHLLARDGARYVLALLAGNEYARVNGRVVDKYPLRDGDLIELVGELTARFTLVR